MARRRRSESGFALLLVFLMAAVLAIALYTEIPRVGFQTQRNKEQLLMERGEQYKLAIRRFMQVNGRPPASLDELESLNNRRFLRRRYKDPLTGKDEWRLIHITNGILTDSKNSKQGTQQQKPVNISDGFLAEMPGLGSTVNTGQQSNPAVRRRASEGGGGVPGTDPSAQNGAVPGVGAPPGVAAGLPPGVPGVPGVPGMPGSANSANAQPGGFPGAPGAPVNSQTGGVSPTPQGGGFVGSGGSFVGGGSSVGSQPNNPAGGPPVYAGQTPAGYPTAPGSNGAPPGFPNPGAATGQPNQAVNMINSILTSPRPGGLAGIQAQNTQMGGGTGIAGVASTVDQDAIMVYDDHTNYSEWEFIYDGKFRAPPDPRQGTGGTAVSQMGNMAGSSPPGTPIGSPIGQTGQPGQTGQMGPGQMGSGQMGPGQTAQTMGQQPGQPGQQMGAPGIAGGGNTQSTNLNLRPGRQ